MPILSDQLHTEPFSHRIGRDLQLCWLIQPSGDNDTDAVDYDTPFAYYFANIKCTIVAPRAYANADIPRVTLMGESGGVEFELGDLIDASTTETTSNMPSTHSNYHERFNISNNATRVADRYFLRFQYASTRTNANDAQLPVSMLFY